MATLILEQADRRRGGVLNGRVVIGRRANSHIAVRDRSVSRIHAWIGRADDGYFIADSGSRTGTKVNGGLMRGRRPLREGDQIQIGPARITFHSNGHLPADLEPLDLSDRTLEGDDGIFLDCACGAPIWVPWDYAGKSGRCRDCDRIVQLPLRPGAEKDVDANNDTMAPGMATHIARRTAGSVLVGPTPVAPESAADQLFEQAEAAPRNDAELAPHVHETFCGACQSTLSLLEETTHCSECGVAFHADCWTENAGCSSYGCTQVGILAPKASPTMEVPQAATEVRSSDSHETHSHPAPPARKIQWSYLLLPASLLLGLSSILTFGGPSLLLAVGIVAYGIRRPVHNRKVNGVVLIISIIAAAAGSGFSVYWWLSAPASGGLRP